MTEIETLDGVVFRGMLENGLRLLRSREKEINRLNVFPVADGDTGINMRLTLENGLRRSEETEELGAFSRSLADGMLLSARGNSGVILSQLFKGIADSFGEIRHADGRGLFEALKNAHRTAYAAVVRPVEGTILTVAREGVLRAEKELTEESLPAEVLEKCLKYMEEELLRTPELLPVLKEAGVVDSGAKGLIAVIEGMLRYLHGDVLPDDGSAETPAHQQAGADLSLVDENSEFIDGYCMEFLLQLMNHVSYDQAFEIKAFTERLEELGESIVSVQSGMRVKVHIHTKKPAPVIVLAQQFGEFLTFKLENMQIQHNEHDLSFHEGEEDAPQDNAFGSVSEENRILNAEKKPLAVIAVANGEGFREMFTDLGCDIVIDGGTTMNTSTEEFLHAFGRVNADAIAVLANNKNVVRAAEQARELFKREDVHILPSQTLTEGYFALAMDVQDSDDIPFRLSQMQRGIESVDTLAVTASVRDYSYRGEKYPEGTFIGLLDDTILYGSEDEAECLIESLKRMETIGERETLLIFTGKGVTDEEADRVYEAVQEAFPDLETEIVQGGQPVYRFLAGLS